MAGAGHFGRGPAFHIPALAVIGVGLIGGSLALALKRRGRVGRVIGAGRSRASLEKALRLGAIDAIAAHPAEAAQAADLIFLSAPVGATAGLLEAIAPALDADKIATDAGSVKGGVCAAAQAVLGARAGRFVPGHPVAGKEHSGVGAASADLFQNHNAVITPLAHTDAGALETVRRMWRAVGARVITLPPELHDQVLALTSHLPHVLAYAMVDLFAASAVADAADRAAGPGLYGDMAAGGFYDFTRTASSDAEMWRDICLMNRAQILPHLAAFAGRLERLGQLIEQADGAALERLFAAARNTRTQVAERRPPAAPATST
ncbi:MAG: prephenate dehydrogenase/arogenate dehydrogenase family protein [Gammaproteobacteria bacterium]|nr:prephenate dehydrogenase/arogenate dehydrogenase family protein [Gammaproteobacteria bacterium]